MENDKELIKLYESIQYIENNSEDNVISEGIWSKIKYGLSKLGRYKAGGKILGKNKVTKDAVDKVRSILNDESNKLLRGLDETIKEVSPEFPNDEKGITFLRGILTMGAFYDSIIAGTKKQEKEEGYMTVDVANQIIGDLRTIVTKYLDVDLAGIYTTMESEEKDGLILTEQEKEMLSEKNWLSRGYDAVVDAKDKAMDGMFGKKKGASKPREDGSRMGAKMDKNSGKQDFESKRMGKDGLESNTLPMALNMVGTALGGLSWLASTDWFKSLFEESFQYTDTEEVTKVVQTASEETLGSINPGEGMTQILSRVFDGVDLSPKSSVGDLSEAISKVGGGSLDKGIELLTADGGIFKDPSAAKQALGTLFNNAEASYGGMDASVGAHQTLGGVLQGEWAGTGKQLGDALVTNSGGGLAGIVTKAITQVFIKTVVKTGVKTGAGLAIAKGLGALLGPVGLGLIAAGALVKVLREKGQRQSRAKTLNDLLQMLQDAEGEPVIEPVKDPVKDPVDPKKIPIPSELGKNRNEIFRLLLKHFGKFDGPVVYGDGFLDKEEARQYGRLRRQAKAGKIDKSEVKDFRSKANRDKYSMMIAGFRKSYPTGFMSRLEKGFGEFGISYTKDTIEEGFDMLTEEDNPDKYKRWGVVFKGVDSKTMDNLDKNIVSFMLAVKTWFAVPVKGVGKDTSKRAYTINYDVDKVKEYHSKFYGEGDTEDNQQESIIRNKSLFEEINRIKSLMN